MKILFIYPGYSGKDVTSRDTSIYPNLGLLTMMTALKPLTGPETSLEYLDGMVYGNGFIRKYIDDNAQSISVLCFSTVSWNYQAAIDLANFAKSQKPQITTIFGNDHFSSLYETAMANQPNISFGFCGNDVVEGFTSLAVDIIYGRKISHDSYPGLVYRTPNNEVRKNLEDPDEYRRLPLVDYALADYPLAHNRHYLAAQQNIYGYMRDRKLRSAPIDIGRGCIKFTGKRHNNIFGNACDFCGIVPGGKAIQRQSANRAWEIIRNAYDQDFNYFYLTADEVPLTLWGLLKAMADHRPAWYLKIPTKERPKIFAYARAEGFSNHPERIDTLVNRLGFDHFMIGFDGLSKISLEVINKRPINGPTDDLFKQNVSALQTVVSKGCLVTAGFVVTHLGITRKIMEENLKNLTEAVSAYPSTFAELDFAPLCPIPGSQSFRYFIEPEYAKKRAETFGLKVNMDYLQSLKAKYSHKDVMNMEDLSQDFIYGCCPELSLDYVAEYLERIRKLANKHSIAIGGGV